MIPRTQYHGTTPELADRILREGFIAGTAETARTLAHETPAVFTTQTPEGARLYGPVVLKVEVDPNARYLTRTNRNIRRGESLFDAANRWLREADERGYDGVYVPDRPTDTGNMTIHPEVLTVAGSVENPRKLKAKLLR